MDYKKKQQDYSYTYGDMDEIVRCLVGMVDSMISDRMSHFEYQTSEDEEFLLQAIEHYALACEASWYDDEHYLNRSMVDWFNDGYFIEKYPDGTYAIYDKDEEVEPEEEYKYELTTHDWIAVKKKYKG